MGVGSSGSAAPVGIKVNVIDQLPEASTFTTCWPCGWLNNEPPPTRRVVVPVQVLTISFAKTVGKLPATGSNLTMKLSAVQNPKSQSSFAETRVVTDHRPGDKLIKPISVPLPERLTTKGFGVGVGVGVTVGCGVAVGVGVGSGVGVGVGVGVAVGSGVGVGCGVGVGSGVGVGVGVGVTVGSGVRVYVGDVVAVGSGLAVGSNAGRGVGALVGRGVAAATGSTGVCSDVGPSACGSEAQARFASINKPVNNRSENVFVTDPSPQGHEWLDYR